MTRWKRANHWELDYQKTGADCSDRGTTTDESDRYTHTMGKQRLTSCRRINETPHHHHNPYNDYNNQEHGTYLGMQTIHQKKQKNWLRETNRRWIRIEISKRIRFPCTREPSGHTIWRKAMCMMLMEIWSTAIKTWPKNLSRLTTIWYLTPSKRSWVVSLNR